MQARVASVKQRIETTPAEELKQKLLRICNTTDGKKQEALCLLFPLHTNFPPPPPLVRKANKSTEAIISPGTRKRAHLTPCTTSPVAKQRTLTIDQAPAVTLKYIIEEPTLCQGFRIHLEKQFAEENLTFYQQACRFRQTCSALSPTDQLK